MAEDAIGNVNHLSKSANLQSSRPGEPPPQALTEPDVKLSPHTALHVPYAARFALLEGSSHLWLTNK